jgi:hypothetical protein
MMKAQITCHQQLLIKQKKILKKGFNLFIGMNIGITFLLTKAPYLFMKWAPIAEELKTLDRKIVLNSVILKWDIIKKEFQERIQF